MNNPTETEIREQKMLECKHVFDAGGASGFATCTKCEYSQLAAHYNMYHNDKLNN